MQLNGLVFVIAVSKIPSLREWPKAVKRAGDRSAILEGVPFVSLRVTLTIELQLGAANQSVLPQPTLQLHDAALLANAKPCSSLWHVQQAPLPHVDVQSLLH